MPPEPESPPELATPPELVAPPDLATPPEVMTPPELAMPPELVVPPELVTPPELATPPELVTPPELAMPPELATPPVSVVPPDVVPPVPGPLFPPVPPDVVPPVPGPLVPPVPPLEDELPSGVVELGWRSPEELHAANSIPTLTAHKTGARTGDGVDLPCRTTRPPCLALLAPDGKAVVPAGTRQAQPRHRRSLRAYFTMKMSGTGGLAMPAPMWNPT